MKSRLTKRMDRYFNGTVEICISGSNAERFLNLCQFQEIPLRDIRRDGSRYRAFLPAKDYFRLRPVIKKTGICPGITRRLGLPFALKRNRKRKILFLCALMFAGMIYYLSGFLWRIEFDGCYYHTVEQLREFLRQEGIMEGIRKSGADCNAIEECIRSNFTDIGWVSAELTGTVMKIHIKETRMPSMSAEQIVDGYGNTWEEETGHIVAAKDGVVTQITVKSGVAQVRVGDVVKEGDILIRGVLEIVGDDGNVTARHPVLADGTVRLKCVEDYSQAVPLTYEKKVYTGKSRSGIKLEIFGRKIFSYNPSNYYQNCDIITETGQYCIGESFYLPLVCEKTTVMEYTLTTETRTKNEAELAADQLLLRYLEEKKRGGAVILEKRLTPRFTKTECVLEGLLIFDESAWKYRRIKSDEWRQENEDEHNTDNNGYTSGIREKDIRGV